jgi:hypothetical protein
MSSEPQIEELKGRRFQIGILTARDGSWVLNESLTKKLPLGLEAVLPFLGPDRPAMSESDFHNVQDRLLSTVAELVTVGDQEVAKKIFAHGKFQIPNLENDLFVVARLTTLSLMATILPFFRESLASTAHET